MLNEFNGVFGSRRIFGTPKNQGLKISRCNTINHVIQPINKGRKISTPEPDSPLPRSAPRRSDHRKFQASEVLMTAPVKSVAVLGILSLML